LELAPVAMRPGFFVVPGLQKAAFHSIFTETACNPETSETIERPMT
jgi:hypothetical protein